VGVEVGLARRRQCTLKRRSQSAPQCAFRLASCNRFLPSACRDHAARAEAALAGEYHVVNAIFSSGVCRCVKPTIRRRKQTKTCQLLWCVETLAPHATFARSAVRHHFFSAAAHARRHNPRSQSSSQRIVSVFLDSASRIRCFTLQLCPNAGLRWRATFTMDHTSCAVHLPWRMCPSISSLEVDRLHSGSSRNRRV